MGRSAQLTPEPADLDEDVQEPGTPLLRSPIITEESAFASSVTDSRQAASQEDEPDLASAPYPSQVILISATSTPDVLGVHRALPASVVQGELTAANIGCRNDIKERACQFPEKRGNKSAPASH